MTHSKKWVESHEWKTVSGNKVGFQDGDIVAPAFYKSYKKRQGWHEPKKPTQTPKGIKQKSPRHRDVQIKRLYVNTQREPYLSPNPKDSLSHNSKNENTQVFDWKKIYNYPNLKHAYNGMHGMFERLEGKDKERFIKELTDDITENGSWEKAEKDAKEFFETKGFYYDQQGNLIALDRAKEFKPTKDYLISDPRYKTFDPTFESSEDARLKEESKREQHFKDEETNFIYPWDEDRYDASLDEAYRKYGGDPLMWSLQHDLKDEFNELVTEAMLSDSTSHDYEWWKVRFMDDPKKTITTLQNILTKQGFTEEMWYTYWKKYPLGMEQLLDNAGIRSIDSVHGTIQRLNKYIKEEGFGLYDEKWFKEVQSHSSLDENQTQKTHAPKEVTLNGKAGK